MYYRRFRWYNIACKCYWLDTQKTYFLHTLSDTMIEWNVNMIIYPDSIMVRIN